MASSERIGLNRRAGAGRDAQRRACDTCKRRKVRCSGETPCQNCVRHASACHYTASHGRLAQSERRLQQLQDRLNVFERIWTQYLPHVELSAALRDTEATQASNAAPSVTTLHVEAAGVIDEMSVMSSADKATQEAGSGPMSPSPPDSEYEEVDTLHWDESTTTSSAADGFGSLSTNWKGIGYMGPTTGNTLLRKLQSLSILYLSTLGDPNQQGNPEPSLPESTFRSPSFANQCVDWYFKYYHGAYPILHEGYFRAQLMGALPKPKDGSWPILLNVVRALGVLSSPSCSQNADEIFQREASSHVTWNILQRGTLSLVQTFGLLANYLQKRNRPNSGFAILGTAMNMAQGIGLHRDLCGPAITPFTMEIRRRVWWTLVVYDAEMRLTFGRPTLNLGGVSTELPRNLKDTDLAVDMNELPAARDYSTVTSSLIWQSKLAKISNSANEKLVDKHVPNLSIMLALGDEVSQWTEVLPSWIRHDLAGSDSENFMVARMVLLWRSMHLRIVIHRPYLLHQIRQRDSLDVNHAATAVSRCFQAAEELVSSILTAWNSTKECHGFLAWHACYFLVTAVFVHIACLLYEPHNASSMHWKQRIEDTEATLQGIGAFEPTALRAARILKEIMCLVPSNPDATIFETDEPIRRAFAGMGNMWNIWNDINLFSELDSQEWMLDAGIGNDNLPAQLSQDRHQNM